MKSVYWLILALGMAITACGGDRIPTTCTADTDCFSNYGCDVSLHHICLPTCTNDDGCIASQHCDVPSGETRGLCRFGHL